MRLVHAVAAATCKRKNDGVAAHTVEDHNRKSVVERRVVLCSVVTFSDVLLRRLYALCMGPQEFARHRINQYRVLTFLTDCVIRSRAGVWTMLWAFES